jgi:hypothetical protein
MESFDMEELHTRTEASLERHKKLVPLVLFPLSVVVYMLFAFIALTAGQLEEPGFDLFMALMGGFMALVMNGISLVTLAGGFDQTLRPQVMARVMAEMLQEQRSGKRKTAPTRLEDEADASDEVVMLGDDGELYRQRRS